MRTLTVHTADELAQRWRRLAHVLDGQAAETALPEAAPRIREIAQTYRVCASELMALVAVSMELEAAHHGDPE
jgi:hypothetical protein